MPPKSEVDAVIIEPVEGEPGEVVIVEDENEPEVSEWEKLSVLLVEANAKITALEVKLESTETRLLELMGAAETRHSQELETLHQSRQEDAADLERIRGLVTELMTPSEPQNPASVAEVATIAAEPEPTPEVVPTANEGESRKRRVVWV